MGGACCWLRKGASPGANSAAASSARSVFRRLNNHAPLVDKNFSRFDMVGISLRSNGYWTRGEKIAAAHTSTHHRPAYEFGPKRPKFHFMSGAHRIRLAERPPVSRMPIVPIWRI